MGSRTKSQKWVKGNARPATTRRWMREGGRRTATAEQMKAAEGRVGTSTAREGRRMEEIWTATTVKPLGEGRQQTTRAEQTNECGVSKRAEADNGLQPATAKIIGCRKQHCTVPNLNCDGRIRQKESVCRRRGVWRCHCWSWLFFCFISSLNGCERWSFAWFIFVCLFRCLYQVHLNQIGSLNIWIFKLKGFPVRSWGDSRKLSPQFCVSWSVRGQDLSPWFASC